ncbi:MAG TPA: single-stranded DNA-binding protein [Saccharofermentans sp.]|nr:single-stranded DNA-binding protein [Saccharofermentans sp.]
MNKVILIGRLTKDPEVKNTSSQVQFCNFTIAVDRRFKDANGQRQADFINCVAWRQTASFIGSYFRKGSKVAVVGSLQSRSYDDQSGQKRYVTEVVVDEVEFKLFVIKGLELWQALVKAMLTANNR